jgi:Seryl-tRNA synthetase N-terminal domain
VHQSELELCYPEVLFAAMLDINLFREGTLHMGVALSCSGGCGGSALYSTSDAAEKGGNPELIRESQRRRYKPTEEVDKVIELDKQWREGMLVDSTVSGSVACRLRGSSLVLAFSRGQGTQILLLCLKGFHCIPVLLAVEQCVKQTPVRHTCKLVQLGSLSRTSKKSSMRTARP